MDLEKSWERRCSSAARGRALDCRRRTVRALHPRADGDVERMKSQIEDLKGLRRGTVRIACSQALALDFLPARSRLPREISVVQFEVKVFDHERAMATLRRIGRSGAVFRPRFSRTFSR